MDKKYIKTKLKYKTKDGLLKEIYKKNGYYYILKGEIYKKVKIIKKNKILFKICQGNENIECFLKSKPLINGIDFMKAFNFYLNEKKPEFIINDFFNIILNPRKVEFTMSKDDINDYLNLDDFFFKIIGDKVDANEIIKFDINKLYTKEIVDNYFKKLNNRNLNLQDNQKKIMSRYRPDLFIEMHDEYKDFYIEDLEILKCFRSYKRGNKIHIVYSYSGNFDNLPPIYEKNKEMINLCNDNSLIRNDNSLKRYDNLNLLNKYDFILKSYGKYSFTSLNLNDIILILKVINLKSYMFNDELFLKFRDITDLVYDYKNTDNGIINKKISEIENILFSIFNKNNEIRNSDANRKNIFNKFIILINFQTLLEDMKRYLELKEISKINKVNMYLEKVKDVIIRLNFFHLKNTYYSYSDYGLEGLRKIVFKENDNYYYYFYGDEKKTIFNLQLSNTIKDYIDYANKFIHEDGYKYLRISPL